VEEAVKKALVALAGSFLLFSFCAPQPAVEQKDRGIYEMLYLHVKSKMKISYDCSAGAALAMRDGKILFEEYLGTTSWEQGAETVNAQSRWPYYSISKEFGAAVLLSLVTEGLISLDDPAARYIDYFTGPGPGGEFARDKVTIRQLASHTSGVTGPKAKDRDPQVPRFSEVTLEFEPGTGFHYNELGMKILGHIMAKVGGKSYEELLTERILEPLGLEKTVGWLRSGDNLAGIVITCDGPESARYSYTKEPYPGSGLYGRMRDILTFAQLWLDGGKIGERVIFDSGLIKEAWTSHLYGKKPTADTHYGLMTWLSPEVDAVFMAGASQSVGAILPEDKMVVLMGLNQIDGGPGWGRPPEEHSAVARVGHALVDLLDR
jgi:CubicO group peptidase (beta-lactamase class C family)